MTLAGEHKAILEVINATDASEFCNKGASFGSIKSLLFSEIQSHTEDAELSKIILDEKTGKKKITRVSKVSGEML